jgi:hypothetical protein
VRAAGKRYQASFRGRIHHARRQSRLRQRQREKVTHHGFLGSGGDASVGDHKREVDDNEESKVMEVGAPHHGAPAPRSIRTSAQRCTWCGARATRLVRLQRWQL